ncbi:MAG TPA: hypothetical protein VL460_02115 [Caulobacteraceae bacterium]|nr:hypothetical protein [Caulobacteraceae bacterium]
MTAAAPWLRAVGPALAVAILAGLAAAPVKSSAAGGGWFVVPHPPKSSDDSGVDAWVKDYIEVGDYLQTGYNSKVLGFLSTTEVEPLGPERIRIWVRFETFRAAQVGDVRVGSFRILTEFDCRQHAHRELAHEFFPSNNLMGVPVRQVSPAAPWGVDDPQGVWAVNGGVVCALMVSARARLARSLAPDGTEAAPAAP